MDHMLPVLPSSSKNPSRTSTPREIMPSSRTSSLRTQTSPTRERNEKQAPSRVQFVPGSSDMYGAVNCNDLKKVKVPTLPAGRLKSGPPLLEIRKLRFVRNEECSVDSNEEDVDPEKGSERDRSVQSLNRKLFHHDSVLVSRGISGLGANVISTCLSFRPLTEEQRQVPGLPTISRCATGLTSGALCIHKISNLYGGNDAEPPSSTVAHYAPRQQRPVTSVAWCSTSSKSSRLVAVGLTGSGSNGAKSGLQQSSSVGRKGPPIRISSSVVSPSAGGDRDFGCLVWDIEGQSSAVGAGGTVGRGAGATVPVKSEFNLCNYYSFDGLVRIIDITTLLLFFQLLLSNTLTIQGLKVSLGYWMVNFLQLEAKREISSFMTCVYRGQTHRQFLCSLTLMQLQALYQMNSVQPRMSSLVSGVMLESQSRYGMQG